MPLAICKIQKIKSWGLLTGNEAHTTRARKTPNANLEVENIRLIGTPNDPDLATLLKDKIGLQKIRSNAVLAVELMLSASAEFFRPEDKSAGGTYEEKCLNDFVQATVTWLHSSWGDRVLRAELHLDEITPHIHAYLVPLDEQGKLNCRALFGSRDKLSQLQDSFADAVAHLGISRGVKGSTANYKTLKKYYAVVNKESEILDLERWLPQPKARESTQSYRQRTIEILSLQLESINYQLNDRTLLLQQKAQLEQTAARSEKLRQELEKQLHSLLELKKQLQDLPLEMVAYELGLNRDSRNNKWLSHNCIIDIVESSFYDSLHNQSGKSALDLVMHVNQCNFNDALIFLRDCFGEDGMHRSATHHARMQALNIAHLSTSHAFIPPISDNSRHSEVEYYLTHERYIPQKFLQTLHQRHLVYADSQGNAVFLTRSISGEATGAYLHPLMGSGDAMNLYPGSRRSQGWFHLTMGGSANNPTTRAMLVSSPIEALSLAVLNAPHNYRTLYLAIDSVSSPALQELANKVQADCVPTRVASLQDIEGALHSASKVTAERAASWKEHQPNLPLEFLQTLPTVIVAMPKVAAKKVHKLVPHATKLEPNISWNHELMQRQHKFTLKERQGEESHGALG